MSEAPGYSYPRIDDMDKAFYVRLAAEPAGRKLVKEITIPTLGGGAFMVEKGQIVRVIAVEGPQVADFNAFFKDDPREMFWSGRTRLLQSAHLSVGDRLWSTPPRMRPMFTIIADTVEHLPLPGNARSHDLMYCRCNERAIELTQGKKAAPSCNSNIANAIAQFGLTPDYVHDAFNIFMTTGLGPNDRFFYRDPDCKKGDYIELYAELDCIVGISACPGNSSGPVRRPIGVEIYDPGLNRG